MANPSNPVFATFPIDPLNFSLPIVKADGTPTVYFGQVLQLIYASIQGNGGLLDMLGTELNSPGNFVSQTTYWTPLTAAASMIISKIPSENILLTGSTPILSLGPGHIGDKKTLRSQDGVVLTANGALLLSNDGQDLRLLPGDAVEVSCIDGTTWAVVGFTPYVNVVPTYAALRALSAFGTTYFIQGRTSPEDGGQGWFAYDPSDTTSADNDGTILVDAASNVWKRVFNGPVFPEWFGARMDGVTDDSVAWNQLISQINLSLIDNIYVSGISFINALLTTITKTVAIHGGGIGTSALLQGPLCGDVILLDISGLDVDQRVTLSDFSFLSEQVNVGQALRLGYTTLNVGASVMLANMEVVGTGTDKLYGFLHGIETVNVSGGSYYSIVSLGYRGDAFGKTGPAKNMQSEWAWYTHATTGNASDNCLWNACTVGAHATAWQGDGHLEGYTWNQCAPGFVGYCYHYVMSDVSLPPYFEWVNCQGEFFLDGIVLTNASYVKEVSCEWYRSANSTGTGSCKVFTTVFVFDSVNNLNLSLETDPTALCSGLICTDCTAGNISGNTHNGVTNYGTYLGGNTQLTHVSDELLFNPRGSTYMAYQNAANSPYQITNTRRRPQVVNAPLDPIDIATSNTSPQTVITPVASPSVANNLASIQLAVAVGERVRLSVYSLTEYLATATQITSRMRESNHAPGTGTPFDILQFVPTKNNWVKTAPLDTETNQCIDAWQMEFDIIAFATDAKMAFDQWVAAGTATNDNIVWRVQKI